MAYEIHGIINEAHELPILCCTFNASKRELYSGSQDASIRVWDVESLKLIRRQSGHKGWVTSLTYASSLKLLFSGSVDGTIIVWNDKGQKIQTVTTGSPIFTLIINERRQLLVTGGKHGINLYKILPAEEVIQLDREFRLAPKQFAQGLGILTSLSSIKSHADNVRAICCSEDTIYSAGYDKRICSYDTDGPKESMVKHDKCHRGAICCIAYDSQTKTIVTGSYDGQVKIWNQAGRCLDVLATFKDTVTSICYVTPTNEFWIVGNDRKVTVYDPRNISEITPYISEVCGFERFRVQKLHHSVGSNVITGITPSRQIVVWKYNPAAPYRVLYGHGDWIETMLKYPTADGDRIFTAGADKKLMRWDYKSSIGADLYTCHEIPDPEPLYTSSITCMDYSVDLDAIITGGEDCAIKLWYLGEKPQTYGEENPLEEELAETLILLGHEGKISGLCVLQDLLLVSTSYDKSIRFWDLHTKLELTEIEKAHDTSLMSVEYNAANAEIATCAVDDHLVKVWCIYRHKLKYLLNCTGDVLQVKWCDNMKRWITSATDQTICFWSSEGELIQTYWHSSNVLTCMYVDALNDLLLLARADRVLEVRDLQDFTLLQRCVGHTDLISSIVYLPEKQQYVTCSWDKTVRLWLLPKFLDAHGQYGHTSHSIDTDDVTEKNYVSSYEREHPLVPPKSLKASASWARVKSDEEITLGASVNLDSDIVSTTTLGKKLEDLEDHLATLGSMAQQEAQKGEGRGNRAEGIPVLFKGKALFRKKKN